MRVATRKNAVKIGDRFGKLVVIGQPFFIDNYGQSRAAAVCQCDCGQIIACLVFKLRVKNIQSCGCLHIEAITAANKKRALPPLFTECKECGFQFEANRLLPRQYCSKECRNRAIRNNRRAPKSANGKSTTRLYRIWSGMIRRCHNQNEPSFRYYGARGITVCDEWRASFSAFETWAMSHGYSPELSIDRIDTSSGYRPDNCRWATAMQQAQNSRKKTSGKSSRFKGVHFVQQTGKYRAHIVDHGRERHLGTFDDEVSAARAYNEAAKEAFGEYAHLNGV